MKAREEPHAAKEQLIGNRYSNTSHFLSQYGDLIRRINYRGK